MSLKEVANAHQCWISLKYIKNGDIVKCYLFSISIELKRTAFIK